MYSVLQKKTYELTIKQIIKRMITQFHLFSENLNENEN